MTKAIRKITLFFTMTMFVFACGKDNNDGSQTTEIPMERPVNLVTDNYTAWPSGVNACVDTYLSIEFKATPKLGAEGKISILNSRGEEVDAIDVKNILYMQSDMPQLQDYSEYNPSIMNALGNRSTGYYRMVYFETVAIQGNSVIIRPHSEAGWGGDSRQRKL